MALLPAPPPRGPANSHHPGPHLPGEDPLTGEDLRINLSLRPEEAEALHAILEDRLESGYQDPGLQRAYRLLGWRLLAAQDGAGLTARMAALAREAETLEEYEAARDRELGPILDGLENPENRDG